MASSPGADAFRLLETEALVELDRGDEAPESVNLALRGYPGRVESLVLKARVLHMLGRHNEMLEVCSDLVTRYPDSAAFHLRRALSLALLKRDPESLAAFQIAYRLDPEFPMAAHIGGIALHCTGLYKKALEMTDRAIEENPDDSALSELLAQRAQTLLALGRFEEAASECERAIPLDPTLANAHIVKSTALFVLGNALTALNSFNNALSLEPSSAHVHLGRSLALQAMGLHDAARDALGRAVELDPRWGSTCRASPECGLPPQALRRASAQDRKAAMNFCTPA